MNESAKFAQSDLIVVTKQRRNVLYHIEMSAENIADYVLIFGDPGRVDLAAENFFERIEFRGMHRGLNFITGATASGVRITLATSGMGTPSIEIVVTELLAAMVIDLAERVRLETGRTLTIIRVGTSGALQPPEILPLGSAVIASAGIGICDGASVMMAPANRSTSLSLDPDEVFRLKVQDAVNNAMKPDNPLRGWVPVTMAPGDLRVRQALEKAAEETRLLYRTGCTVSAPSFFCGQGRDILSGGPNDYGIEPAVIDIDKVLANVSRFIMNFEMETSLLFRICWFTGHRAGAICVAVAQRQTDQFADDIEGAVLKTLKAAFRAVEILAGV